MVTQVDESTAQSGARSFEVHFSPGTEPQAGEPAPNSLGLSGNGSVGIDADSIAFHAVRSGVTFGRGRPLKYPRAQIGKVEYIAESRALLLRFRDGNHLILWATSNEDAAAMWSMLPQQPTAEFLAEQAHRERFAQSMQQLGARAPVTPVLIGLNFAVFVLMMFAGADLVRPDSSVHIRFGSNYGPLTWTGQPWRLLTSTFIHFGIVHILLNMYALHQGGALVERLFGSARFLLIYLLAGLAGSVASGWWDPLRNSAGASGAIFGVFGALLAFMVLRRADIPPRLLKSISLSTLFFCMYSLAIGYAHPVIDNAAHVGGLLGGLVAGALLVRPFAPEARTAPQPMRLLLVAAAICVPLALLAAPLISSSGEHGASLRLERDIAAFTDVEESLLRKQAEIMSSAGRASGDRFALARRMREEVLEPWHAASAILLGTATLPQDGSRASRLQAALREYMRSREKALSLTIVTLQTGDPEDEARMRAEYARMGKLVERVNLLARERS